MSPHEVTHAKDQFVNRDWIQSMTVTDKFIGVRIDSDFTSYIVRTVNIKLNNA